MDGSIIRRLAVLYFVLNWPNYELGPRFVSTVQAAQESATTEAQVEARDRIRVISNLVVLPVTVKDARGNLVPGLQKKDFRVFDDGFEQAISVFTAEAFPLSVVVLVDDDLPSEVAEQMVKSLRAAAGGFGPEDEEMVCRYDLFFYPGKAFVHDLDAIWKELEEARNYSGPSTAGPVPFVTPPSTHAPGVGEPAPAAPVNLGHAPTKALDDAIYSAAELLRERGRDRRKIILLISDGENGEKFNHHTYVDTAGALLGSNISVFSLAVGSKTSFMETEGLRALKYRKRFSRLAAYANDSGGDVYFAAKSGSMERLYARITEEARHEYTLAYVPVGNNKNSDYHAVEVRVARPEVIVKTRRGYQVSSSEPRNQ